MFMFKSLCVLIIIIGFLEMVAFTCTCLFPDAKVICGNIGLGLIFLMFIIAIILMMFNDKI